MVKIFDVVLCCSIGSLGAGNSEAEVSNVFVNRATLTGTTNGVRIKTWQVYKCLTLLLKSAINVNHLN